MTKFALVFQYTGDYPTDEAGQAAMGQAWGGWYGSLGPAIVDAGGPASQVQSVTAGSTSDATGTITGCTLVEAADMSAAVEMAKANPIVAADEGSIQVVELADM